MWMLFDTEVWIDLARTLGERGFVAKHPGWFLLVSREPGESPTLEQTRSATSSAAMARRLIELRWVGSPDAHKRRFTVGRSRTCDVAFGHASVSKLHAHFDLAGKKLTVTDEGSRNGTKINGEPIAASQPKPLKLRDRVQFGSVQALVLDA